MTYPVVVFVIAILAVVGMLLFIVPIFAKMFSDMGGTLPLPTQILVVLSHGDAVRRTRRAGAGASSSPSCGARSRTRDGVRNVVDPLKLKMPDLRAAGRRRSP